MLPADDLCAGLRYDGDGSGGAYQAQTLAKLENAAVLEMQHFVIL